MLALVGVSVWAAGGVVMTLSLVPLAVVGVTSSESLLMHDSPVCRSWRRKMQIESQLFVVLIFTIINSVNLMHVFTFC